MRGVRIPHDLNGEDRFVLGLSVTRLAALFLGLLASYTILHLSLPWPLRLGAAAAAALAGAAIAWVRPEGRSLIHWTLAAIEFKVAQHLASSPEGNHRANARTPLQPNSQLTIERGQHLRIVATQSQPTTHDQRASIAPTRLLDDDAGVIELSEPASGAPRSDEADRDAEPIEPAPVYLGGPQVITFFSTKGGTGRTTLATEIAALLAMKGRYRESSVSPPRPLRVVLVDFDLASANVSARLGVAQPTMLDYLCDLSVPHPDPRDYIVRHQATGLDVLLGPSKCLAGDRAELFGVPQAAHILSALKEAEYQFLILDMSANLGDLETYLLEAATRIHCVVTPTAGSVQSLYRGVEALRRLGVGAKLQYVANKMRGDFNLAEPMGDLNGTLVARIPYDPAFDTAENRHEPIVMGSTGTSQDALRRLAASIYPALQLPTLSRTRLPAFAWLARGRRAG
jgi:MinD-like ATPase involved in chromosome partitioning or flagellar assembly